MTMKAGRPNVSFGMEPFSEGKRDVYRSGNDLRVKGKRDVNRSGNDSRVKKSKRDVYRFGLLICQTRRLPFR